MKCIQLKFHCSLFVTSACNIMHVIHPNKFTSMLFSCFIFNAYKMKCVQLKLGGPQLSTSINPIFRP